MVVNQLVNNSCCVDSSVMKELIENCTVRLGIEYGTFNHRGNGFFVAPNLVLTCAHVVKGMDNIFVNWRGNNYLTQLHKILPNPYPEKELKIFPDIALVKVIMQEDHPCVLLEEGYDPNDDLYAFGCTQDRPTGDPVTLRAEGYAGFSEIPDSDQRLLKFKDGVIPYGMSGSPVLNLRTGTVCGMVKRTRDMANPLGGYAIRAEAILEHYPELCEIQDQFHKKHPAWLSAIGRYSSATLHHWLAWEEERRRMQFQPQLVSRETVLSSPLTDVWGDFIGKRAWHKDLDNKLNAITSFQYYPELKRFTTPFIGIDCSRNYRELHEDIKNHEPKKVIDTLGNMIRELQRKKDHIRLTNEDQNLLYAAKKLNDALHSLCDFIEKSQFHRCFCVMGALGSGRTQFITSLLGGTREVISCNYLLLPLTVRPHDGALKSLFLNALRSASGINWRTIEECDNTLSLEGKRVVVVLDDLQLIFSSRSNFDIELQAFVEATTQYHSLYWLFTLHDTSYDTISRHKSFWKMYGYENESLTKCHYADRQGTKAYVVAQRTGWLMLNELNRAKNFGFELLKAIEKDKLAAELVSAHAPIIRYMAQPFVAWIVKQLSDTEDVSNLVTLDFIGFVDCFWEDRIDKIDPFPLSAKQLRQCVGFIAKLLVEKGQLMVPADEVLNILSANNDYALANNAITVLEKMSLLSKVLDDSSKVNWEDPEMIQLQFEVFWHRHFAAQMFKIWELRNGELSFFKTDIHGLFRSTNESHIREGIWQFFLLLIDQKANQDVAFQDVVWQMWLLALEKKEITVSAVFFAGVRASSWIQVRFLDHLRLNSSSYGSGRILFALMHFLSESEIEIIALPERIKLLQPHFENIRESVLTEYYLFLSNRIISREKDLNVLREIMHYFAGSHVLGINVASELATLCWDRIQYLADDIEDVTLAIINYIVDDASSAAMEYYPYESNHKKKPQGCYFFREWVLNLYCDWLVTELGIGAYEVFLLKMGYGTDQPLLSQHIFEEAKREINLAFGRWYRHHLWQKHDRDSKNNVLFYRELVARLYHDKSGIGSSRILQNTAYFLVRHTGRIGRNKGRNREMLVDQYFTDIINEMRKDQSMKKLLDKYPIALPEDSYRMM
jgi:hypothetical protein